MSGKDIITLIQSLHLKEVGVIFLCDFQKKLKRRCEIMQSIETLLVMNLLVMIILGLLASFKMVASFLVEYIGFKMTMEVLKEEKQQTKQEESE